MLFGKLRKACLLAIVAALLTTPTIVRAQEHDEDEDYGGSYLTCENSYSTCGCHRDHAWYCMRKHNTKTTGTCGSTGSCPLNHWGHGNCYTADGEPEPE